MSIRVIENPNYTWIDLLNPQMEELHEIAEKYKLNFYTLSDSLEPNHLPKYELEDNINFVIARIIRDHKSKIVNVENISNKIAIFYNDKIIISIHKIEMKFLDEIIEKYVEARKAKTTSFVVIKILWSVLYTYDKHIFEILDQIDTLENKVFQKIIPVHTLQEIYFLKRKSALCRKMLILTEDVITSIKIGKQEKPAFHDLTDFYTKLITYYDQALDGINILMNIYISLSSQKTNDIMKTLTIFSIFFMPLTFIAGIYGMNLKIPEFDLDFGYPLVLMLMLIVTIVIYYWFKRKKWL